MPCRSAAAGWRRDRLREPLAVTDSRPPRSFARETVPPSARVSYLRSSHEPYPAWKPDMPTGSARNPRSLRSGFRLTPIARLRVGLPPSPPAPLALPSRGSWCEPRPFSREPIEPSSFRLAQSRRRGDRGESDPGGSCSGVFVRRVRAIPGVLASAFSSDAGFVARRFRSAARVVSRDPSVPST